MSAFTHIHGPCMGDCDWSPAQSGGDVIKNRFFLFHFWYALSIPHHIKSIPSSNIIYLRLISHRFSGFYKGLTRNIFLKVDFSQLSNIIIFGEFLTMEDRVQKSQNFYIILILLLPNFLTQEFFYSIGEFPGI